MKKLVALLITVLMLFSVVGCSGGTTQKPDENKGGETGQEAQYDIVMLMDNVAGSINDGSFLEGTWNGISKFCEETGAKATYFTPAEESKEAYLSNMEQAVGVGAKYIVCPGYLFEEAIYEAQELYPDVNFILIDGRPHNADYSDYKTGANTYSILFAEEEAGFLAGYAAIKEGFRNLAFFGGMAVTSVARFGYGFVEGSDYAAKELGLNKGDVNIIYWYSGDFLPSPEKLTTVTGWYNTGTEVIFSCGGSICDNAFSAAETLGKKVIGVDIDQASESETCITSAMKDLANATYSALIAGSEGNFPGGVDATLGTAEDCVGLPTSEDSWRFENFTVEEYEAIYQKLKNDEGGLASGLLTDADIEAPTEIPVEIVTLDYKN
jgi:basic membrane protein A